MHAFVLHQPDPSWLLKSRQVFKTVHHTDIDMLLPGAEAKFTWIDYLLIWGSIAVAIGMASYKVFLYG